MNWCARESGICVCPWGSAVAIGYRNLTKWSQWQNQEGMTESDFIQLDNTKPYKQVQFDYNVTECASRFYDDFDPDLYIDEQKDCFCMNFVDENVG